MSDTLNSLGEEIFSELGEPDNLTSGSISCWIKANIGEVEAALHKSYTLTDSGDDFEFEPALDAGSKAFLKLKYSIYNARLVMSSLLGAAGYEVQSITSDGATVKTVDKSVLAKTYLELIKDLNKDLKDLINYYRNDKHTIHSVYSEDAYYTGIQAVPTNFNRTI